MMIRHAPRAILTKTALKISCGFQIETANGRLCASRMRTRIANDWGLTKKSGPNLTKTSLDMEIVKRMATEEFRGELVELTNRQVRMLFDNWKE